MTQQGGKPLPWPVEFAVGAVASSCACLFTNPIEVIKTRLQLQGELNLSAHRPYSSNPLSAFATVFRSEGLAGVQKGLFPAIGYQVAMNGVRLGSYAHIQKALGANSPETEFFFLRNLAAGAICGMLGGIVSNPFFLAKVRLQARAKDPKLSVGFQHKQSSAIAVFREIISTEGVVGLWRGSTGQIARVAAGSSVQLSFYDSCKLFLQKVLDMQGPALHLSASSLTSLFVVAVMNPLDVIATRLYNQPVSPQGKGLLYSGLIDCGVKVFREEGMRGFYKGVAAHALRLCPHTILTLTFWEQTKKMAISLRDSMYDE